MSKLISRLILGLALAALVGSAQFGQPPGVFNKQITVTSGTPIRITTTNVVVDSLMIQALHGASAGLVYVCAYATTPSSKCSGHSGAELGAEVAAASTTAPGGSYSYPMPIPGLNLSYFWIDGEHSGDVVLATWHVK